MSIRIVGLGPAGLDHLPARNRDVLLRADATVILRTLSHPAAAEIAGSTTVASCDDLYESAAEFTDLYASIVDRVMEAARAGDVVYGVPGSPHVGEQTTSMILAAAAEEGIDVDVVGAPSFLDRALEVTAIDPIRDGLQVVDAHALPDPLPLHLPTLITQVDSPLRLADVAVELGRLLEPTAAVTILDRLADPDEVVRTVALASLAEHAAGPRTTLFVEAQPVGLLGLVETNRILRAECPWDMRQTHHSLLTHLIEEAYETADAIGRLPMASPAGTHDFGAYAEVEDELGDLLLQVLFHATMAAEAGAFDIDDVAEHNRRKLVRRHPHVFGDVDVAGADEVLANWEQIKQSEKNRASLMDDIPAGMPAVGRAMKVQKRAASVGFDWREVAPIFDVVRSEIDELAAAHDDREATTEELGDILFAVINLARHLRVDPEIALRGSVDRFIDRFRHVESAFSSQNRAIAEASPEELDAAWEAAKRATRAE
ncbi:MAG: nucleoside triphosphate pyrophosphohydrolase [Acidimicrobiia bacterium]|nr:nucleoside triphosphate pyrophosphohydrolase [Acidimicrobiia bacterium]